MYNPREKKPQSSSPKEFLLLGRPASPHPISGHNLASELAIGASFVLGVEEAYWPIVCGHRPGSVQSQVIRRACISSLFILLMATKVHLFHVKVYTTMVQNRAFAWTLSWNAVRVRFMPV